MAETSDIALLREYLDRDSETAFAGLVQRHVNLVYSVALRYTGNSHDAQDVTQAVFVILAKRAASLRGRTNLTGWLYETARFTSRQLLRTRARQQAREQEAYMQSTLNDSETESIWRQLAPLLEEAMSRLSEKERTLLALRFFENKNGAETAALMGINEWAARKRIDRAMGKIQKFFSMRGIDSTTTAITGAISANSVQAAPIALAKTATAVALAKGATASTSTLTLIKGALKIMAWTKAKTAIVTGLVILAAAGSTTVAFHELSQTHAKPPFKDFIKQISQQPGGALTMEAATLLVHLKPQGRLPGFPTNEPATTQLIIQNLSQDSNGVWQPSTATADIYPVSRTFHASKNNDGHFVYYYTVEKKSATNGWLLRKAWLSDTNGKVVKEFPVQ